MTRIEVDGHPVEVADDTLTLLDVLRDQLGSASVKDGCSPQGQCGCCTVLVDGQPRVACVTPVRRVADRRITTLDGLPERDAWSAAFTATGASQCGFCTPGIIVRLAGLRAGRGDDVDDAQIHRSLAAHLCRCTGWQTIAEAYRRVADSVPVDLSARDLDAAARRATIEGRSAQSVGAAVASGQGGFAADIAPADALVAVPDGAGGWAVAESLAAARRAAGKVQGRRTTMAADPPLVPPPGDWDLTLRTPWVEPAYLETDASWCAPGGVAATPLANGGAFGAKTTSIAPTAARELADRHGRSVLVCLSREDAVARGPKRPPIAAGLRGDGTGTIRVVRTPGWADAVARITPDLSVEEVDIAGPATSAAIRGAGWVEAVVLLAGARGAVGTVRAPDGGRARADIGADGRISIWVDAGAPLDDVVLRSYCIGAAHMAHSWVTSEALAVDPDGEIHDLTIRSFGILGAAAMPPVDVSIEPSTAEPVNGSDAVFAAVAAATWLARGLPDRWPC